MADNAELTLELIMCRLFAEVICEDVKDNVRALHFDALKQLQGQLRFYEERGFRSKLLCGIAEKRGEMILKTSSKTEMERVMSSRAPHYDGAKFVPDQYSIPEEEMIAWSETSLRGPLIEPALKRYMELFEQIFPEKYAEVMTS